MEVPSSVVLDHNGRAATFYALNILPLGRRRELPWPTSWRVFRFRFRPLEISVSYVHGHTSNDGGWILGGRQCCTFCGTVASRLRSLDLHALDTNIRCILPYELSLYCILR